jgi:hypothetical protein
MSLATQNNSAPRRALFSGLHDLNLGGQLGLRALQPAVACTSRAGLRRRQALAEPVDDLVQGVAPLPADLGWRRLTGRTR